MTFKHISIDSKALNIKNNTTCINKKNMTLWLAFLPSSLTKKILVFLIMYTTCNSPVDIKMSALYNLSSHFETESRLVLACKY